MKRLKSFLAVTLSLVYLAGPIAVFAGDSKPKEKAKPYTLKNCPVSDEKLGGDMGDPYVFTHEGREIKLCCKSCLKDFKKDPSKYIKKIEAEAKKASK